MRPDTRCLQSHLVSGMRAAFSASLACCRRCPDALFSRRSPVCCNMHSRAQVEFMSVEPKLCHQGAKQHNMVLQLTAVGSKAVWVGLYGISCRWWPSLSSGCKRWCHIMAGLLQLGRALAAWRHTHIFWKLLVRSFQWCARAARLPWVALALGSVRHCWQRAAKSACGPRALHVVHTHLFHICVSHAVPHCRNTLPACGSVRRALTVTLCYDTSNVGLQYIPSSTRTRSTSSRSTM